MPDPKTESVQVTLPADQSLDNHFDIDQAGNVTIKNTDLTDMLKKNLKNGLNDPNINAIKVGLIVDM